jgi:16S rRNA (adenine1518-N6/adenine1519-N6)-dimethyltransferase
MIFSFQKRKKVSAKDDKPVSSALTDLKEMMEKLGIEPKRSLGQNFLISDHVIEKIVKAVNDLKPDTLYEVGPGLGALTRHLRLKNSSYHLIELDRIFADHWRSEGFQVFEKDALHLDWQSLPQQGRRVLVSNLPYQISSSLLIDRSLDANPLDGMVLMFQKEVAQRIRATCHTENYGLLSVIAQMAWDIEMLLEASPRDFQPAPKVASRVLVFRKKSKPLVREPKKFLKFVKAAFLHRRKLLIGNLEEGANTNRERSESALISMKLSAKARAQELSLQQYIDLYQKLGYEDGL